MDYIKLRRYKEYLYLTKNDLINFLFLSITEKKKTKILQKLKNKNFYGKTKLFTLKNLQFSMCLDTHDKGKLFGDGYELCNHEDERHFEVFYDMEKICKNYFDELINFVKK
jgi:hypothetical protein